MIAFFLVILFFLLFNYYLLGFRSQRPVSGAIFSLSPVFLGLPFCSQTTELQRVTSLSSPN